MTFIRDSKENKEDIEMKKFNVIVLLTIISLAGLLTSCKEKKEVLSIYNWTYYTPDEVLRDFEKEFNFK